MNLLIVESPAKTRTLKKFLGKDYEIAATLGHIRDLPKKKLGVDIEDNFKPEYITISNKKKVISNLRKQSKKAKQVWLAMDPDREGEAIAWHTAKALQLGENYQRIVFHEITEQAVKKALKNPRKIDQDVVDAQQARRILDRVVGYKLSPLLWKKITKGLSAGRVQSVALKLIVDREKEIKDFIAQEYWSITATLSKNKQEANEFEALLSKENEKVIKKLDIKSKKQAEEIINNLKDAKYIIKDIDRTEVKKSPFPPFITSTLQQEMWKKFYWPAKMTMSIAQQLYEKGFITYHRSDSLNLSSQALQAAQEIILKDIGKDYYPGNPRRFKTSSKSAQEAHEAIRPTHPKEKPDNLKSKLDEKQIKLYTLIWKRFIACQMEPAVFDRVGVDIQAKKYTFRANGQTLKFDGFLKVYPVKFKEAQLPELNKEQEVELKKLAPEQHFTQPSGRYSEASLIKELEKNGVGRPSTYASIISVIQYRGYVNKNEAKKFYPEEIGILVGNLLSKHFPEIVDIKFTAKMEEDLDEIAQGKRKWVDVLQDFYKPFAENLEKKNKEITKHIEKTEEKCPKCGEVLVVRFSRFGKFYGCSKYPKCKFIKPLKTEVLDIKCPKCKKGDITEKRTKKGKVFYGCNQWPKCDFALWDKPTKEKCPKCDSLLVEKNKKIKCSNKDCDFSKTSQKNV